jgi:negative regulator of flagellin synthesis FlgM
MDIRNNLDGLRSLLGVGQTTTPAAAQQSRNTAPAETTALISDSATLSSAGSEVSQTAADPEVRMDKVATIQAALAAGTYNVPASAVASKVVDAMLGGN